VELPVAVDGPRLPAPLAEQVLGEEALDGRVEVEGVAVGPGCAVGAPDLGDQQRQLGLRRLLAIGVHNPVDAVGRPVGVRPDHAELPHPFPDAPERARALAGPRPGRGCWRALDAQVVQPDAGRLLVAGQDPGAGREWAPGQLPRHPVRGDVSAADLQPAGAAVGVDRTEPAVVRTRPVDLRLEALGERSHDVLPRRTPADLAGGVRRTTRWIAEPSTAGTRVAPGCIAPVHRAVHRARDTRPAFSRRFPRRRQSAKALVEPLSRWCAPWDSNPEPAD
jgi:hypothetical protein